MADFFPYPLTTVISDLFAAVLVAWLYTASTGDGDRFAPEDIETLQGKTIPQLCHWVGGELELVLFLLGYASVQTALWLGKNTSVQRLGPQE